MIDQEQEEPQVDLTNVTDLDTARLALRWATDKIQALKDELGSLREDFRVKADINKSLTEQIKQRDAILKKWQSTVRSWEENYKHQSATEEEIRKRLREEVVNEEAMAWNKTRTQLETQLS